MKKSARTILPRMVCADCSENMTFSAMEADILLPNDTYAACYGFKDIFSMYNIVNVMRFHIGGASTGSYGAAKMGWYFKKSKSVGPFRLNFSKSGIGVSTGIKGARISFGPKGTYVNIGRGGIYYRKKIGSSPEKKAQSKGQAGFIADNEQKVLVSQAPGNESEYGATILKDIERSKTAFWIWCFVSILLLFVIGWWAIPAAALFRLLFSGFFCASVNYEFDEQTAAAWDKCANAIYQLQSSNKIWVIESSSRNTNVKAHAGAQTSFTRKPVNLHIVMPGHKTEFKVKCDVKAVVLESKSFSALFLPSDVLIKTDSSLVAVAYEQLQISAGSSLFVEDENLPSDAEIAQWTWKYVNKNGTPDKRYNGNRELPVCRYGRLTFKTQNGLNLDIQTSSNKIVASVKDGFDNYTCYLLELKAATLEDNDGEAGEVAKFDEEVAIKKESEPVAEVVPDKMPKSAELFSGEKDSLLDEKFLESGNKTSEDDLLADMQGFLEEQ